MNNVETETMICSPYLDLLVSSLSSPAKQLTKDDTRQWQGTRNKKEMNSPGGLLVVVLGSFPGSPQIEARKDKFNDFHDRADITSFAGWNVFVVQCDNKQKRGMPHQPLIKVGLCPTAKKYGNSSFSCSREDTSSRGHFKLAIMAFNSCEPMQYVNNVKIKNNNNKVLKSIKPALWRRGSVLGS
jgi:hypothetical protein